MHVNVELKGFTILTKSPKEIKVFGPKTFFCLFQKLQNTLSEYISNIQVFQVNTVGKKLFILFASTLLLRYWELTQKLTLILTDGGK